MAYVDRLAPRLTKVLDGIIPSDSQKLKEWMELRFPTHHKAGTFERPGVPYSPLKYQKDDITGEYLISITLPWLGNVLRFRLNTTPACCAMSFMHSFIVMEPNPFTEEEFNKILTAAFQDFNQNGMLSSRRIILNMVECGRKSSDPLKVMEPIDNPVIKYKPYWTYFHKNAAKVNTMLMPNSNTGNIIHHMEVLFDPSFFKE